MARISNLFSFPDYQSCNRKVISSNEIFLKRKIQHARVQFLVFTTLRHNRGYDYITNAILPFSRVVVVNI